MTGPLHQEPRVGPPVGTFLVVLVLAAFAVLGAQLHHDAPTSASGTQVNVEGATAVCPDLRIGRSGGITSRASVGSAPLPDGATSEAGSGQVQQHTNSTPLQVTKVPVEAPGQVAVGLGTTLRDDALVFTATGSLSGGLEAEQVTRGERLRDRGLAGLRCDAPHAEAWFVGGGTTLTDVSTLVLANVDDTPSTVDVTVFSATGMADPRPGSGITIKPHSRVVVNMDTLAPDRRLLAVHVHSRQGRVAATIRLSQLSGGTPLGIDFVPQSVPPATTVLVPGIPKLDKGSRVVLVTNPGLDDTTVSLQLTTEDGQFVPTGMDAVAVPSGTTVAVPVDKQATDSALAVRVVSTNGPVLAGGFVSDQQDGSVIRDFSYSAGSLPLSGPALLTDLVIDKPTESTLILTAPDTAAVVRITPIRVLGTKGALPTIPPFNIPAGRTITIKLSALYPSGANVKLALQVQADKGSGPVYAARYLRERGAHGPLTTLLDLQGPAVRVTRPAVGEDPRAGY